MTLELKIKEIEASDASKVIKLVTDYLDGESFSRNEEKPKLSFTYEKDEPLISCSAESTPFSRYINLPIVSE